MLACLMFFSFFSLIGGYFITAHIVTFLGPIVKTVLIGLAVIILLPRLISLVPVVIFLAILGALVNKVKRIVG